MTEGKAARYVIFGAGAIGGSLAALLARAGVRVVCVARPAHAEALARGITINRDGVEFIQRVPAVTRAEALTPEDEDIIILTVKSQSTPTAVAELAAVFPDTTPFVCLQNGVTNEEIASRSFKHVYAALVFFSAVQLQPDRIDLPRGRSIAIQSVDERAARIAADLRQAGFDTFASAYAMAMKWSKFVVNLNNATYTITGYFVERGYADPEMRQLMSDIREEGLRVLKAAGIAVEPPPGEPTPIRISELHEKAKAPPPEAANAMSLPEAKRTYPSMLQDLELGRTTSEVNYLNGVIVDLGRRIGVATPYNSTLLEVVTDMFASQKRPGMYTPSQLRGLIHSRMPRAGAT